MNETEYKELTKIKTHMSLFQIFSEYIGIALCIFLCIKFWSIPFYILCSLYIVSRKHGLGIILHDGIHYKISKNKILNDLITDFFISFPLFASLSGGRNIHFQHHQNANTDNDPDWVIKKGKEWIFPQKRLSFLYNIFKYSFCIHIFLIFFNRKKTIKHKFIYVFKSITVYFINFNEIKQLNIKTYPYSKLIRFIYYFSIISIFLYFNLFYYLILFWILPRFIWGPFIMRIRTITEHFGMKESNEKDFSLTRTMYPTFIDKYFLSANWNCTYHLDHHLYPNIPSYNLKKLHKHLKNTPEYQKHAHITPNGFYGVFLECTKKYE